jgi:phosphate transport system ATP-binding protein
MTTHMTAVSGLSATNAVARGRSSLGGAGQIEAEGVCAWFSGRLVLELVTALIGPSGCGKSTFLRILNRMHEVIPGAQLAGSVKLDGLDIYGSGQRAVDTRRHIGMVFQKPNPFPAMTIADNVLSGLKFSRVSPGNRADLVEEMLTKAGLWNEVKDRLGELGGALSGGQQQRLCIARALAVRPRVLLMDEPCSALDPTSTRRIERTIKDIADEVTVVIVTHNMQQAQRVSNYCAFFLAEENKPGRIVESGTTEMMFADPSDQRTADYVNGQFG